MNILLLTGIIAIAASIVYSAYIGYKTWKEDKVATDESEWGIAMLVSGGVMIGFATNDWPIGIALGAGLIFLGFIALKK